MLAAASVLFTHIHTLTIIVAHELLVLSFLLWLGCTGMCNSVYNIHALSLAVLRAVLMWPCYEYLSQSPLLPAILSCIIMSSDPPPRRSSRLSNKRTVVPDDGTESVAMTVTKRRAKRTDAGRRSYAKCSVDHVWNTSYSFHSSNIQVTHCLHAVVITASMECWWSSSVHAGVYCWSRTCMASLVF